MAISTRLRDGTPAQTRANGHTYRMPAHWKRERNAEVVRLYVDEKLSSLKIAKRMGMSYTNVLVILERAHVPRRHRESLLKRRIRELEAKLAAYTGGNQ